MDSNKVTPPNSPAQDFRVLRKEADMDVWEPPFERWIRLADNLLTGWVCINGRVPQRRSAKPQFAVREC